MSNSLFCKTNFGLIFCQPDSKKKYLRIKGGEKENRVRIWNSQQAYVYFNVSF